MSSLKELIQTLKQDTWILPLFGAYKKPCIVAIILGLLTFLFASALMFTSGYLVSASVVVASVLMLHIPLICVQVFGLGRPILSYCERLTSHDWVFRITTRLRTKLYNTLEPHSVFYRTSVRLGDSLGLLNEDIGHIQDLYLRSIFPMVTAELLYIGIAIALGFFSLPLMLLWLLVLGGVTLALPVWSIVILGPKQQLIKRYTHELYEDLSDNIQGANDWLFAGRSEDFIASVEAKAEKRSSVQSSLVTLEHIRHLIMQGCFLVIILAFLAWAALTFGGTPNAHTDALNWIAAFSLAFFPLIDAFVLVPSSATSTYEKLVTIKRLNSLNSFSEKAAREKYTQRIPTTDNKRKPTQSDEPTSFDLALTQVSFTYAHESHPALTNLTLDIPQGTKLMIIGPSGAGKTTLSLLLRGDLIPDGGQITLGGIPVASFDDTIARAMCVISQDPHLFDLTIAENIRLANPKATDEDLWAVLEVLNLKTFVERLPKQLETRIGERAHTLSGGQRQRLALARALVSSAPILLLDEATSALDPSTEVEILARILRAWSDKTIIFITHHLIMAPAFDRIVNIQKGSLIYDESFQVLMKHNPHFASLYECDSANEC